MANTGINRCLSIALLLLLFLRVSAQQPDWNHYADVKERLSAIRKYGMDLIKKQQYDQALNTFSTGLKISQQAALDSFTAANLALLGTTYRYKTHFDSAFYFYGKAGKIAAEKKYI